MEAMQATLPRWQRARAAQPMRREAGASASAAQRGRRAARWLLLVAGSAALHVAALRLAVPDDAAPGGKPPAAVRPDVAITLLPARALAAPPAAKAAPPFHGDSAAPAGNTVAAAPAVAAEHRQGDDGRTAALPSTLPLTASTTARLPEIAPIAAADPAAALAAIVQPDPAFAYRRPAELSRRPTLLTPIELDMPGAPRLAAQTAGRLRMRLLISEYGRIDRIVIDESTMPEAEQQFALERFATAQFRPGELDGRAVPSQITIEVNARGG